MGWFTRKPKEFVPDDVKKNIEEVRWVRRHLASTTFSYASKPDGLNGRDKLEEVIDDYLSILEGYEGCRNGK